MNKDAVRLAKAFRAWQAENPKTDFAIGMVPGVGTAYGAASTAAAEIDPDASGLEKTLAAASMLPFGKLIKPAKAGIVASTKGVRNLLAHRQAAINRGEKLPELKTWADDVDSMRHEIDDSVSKYIPRDKQTSSPLAKVRFLDDYLDHPELYKAYPDLKKMLVKERTDWDTNRWGLYDGSLHLNASMSDAEKHTTLLHEIQHAIQHKEGQLNEKYFPDYMGPGGPSGDHATYLKQLGEVEPRTVEQRQFWGPESRARAPFAEHAKLERTRVRAVEMSPVKKLGDLDDKWRDKLMNSYKVQKRIARGATDQILPPKWAASPSEMLSDDQLRQLDWERSLND